MQNILSQLQEILKRHYDLAGELELVTLASYQSLHKELYSKLDQVLSIPIFQPHTRRPIGFFTIKDFRVSDATLIERIQDLVQVTLQSYVDLLDQMEVSDNLLQYLQMELHPQKIIKLQKPSERQEKQIITGSTALKPLTPDSSVQHREILLYSKSRQRLDSLAIHIHDRAQNQFFIRTDHMPPTFLNSLNDLTGLEKVTLYIPRMNKLSPLQQKTLETYFLLGTHKSNSLLIVAGTRSPVNLLLSEDRVSENLLKNFHLFHLVAEDVISGASGFESLSQCATAILGMDIISERPFVKSHLKLTKSYNLIPALDEQFPTIH